MLALAAATITLITLLPTPVHALWPLPASFVPGTSPLRLSPSFTILTALASPPPGDLAAAIQRAHTQLFSDQLNPLVPDHGAALAQNAEHAPALGELVLRLDSGSSASVKRRNENNDGDGDREDCAEVEKNDGTDSWGAASIAEESVKPLGTRDEAYTLSVPADGKAATLTANTTLGLLRGLTTFTQLWYTANVSEHEAPIFLSNAPIKIQDKPAFPYRGFMLDTARNFFPVSDILRTIDAMSWVKLNELHWHIVDSQSFPLQLPGFTEIAAAASYGPGAIYSRLDVQNVISYAAERGIDVMLEIDTPGHTSAIGISHPEHIACFEATPWSTFANEPPSGQLRIASQNTTQFTSNLLSTAVGLTPSTLFSTGGDEINIECYARDAQTQAELKAANITLTQALQRFTDATHAAVRKAGKTPVVWEEMVLSYDVNLPTNDTVVMVWISSEDVAAVVNKGFRVVHAASDYFYLDCGAGAWLGDFPTGNSWCEPFKTWQRSYTFDPFANLSSSAQSLILGGEHLLWTEQSGPQNLDSIVWPRAAAGAEVFWSGAGGNVTSALPRLHDISFRMRQRGVRTISLQPEWCALRPDKCDITA